MKRKVSSLDHDEVMQSKTHFLHVAEVVDFFAVRNKSEHDVVFLVVVEDIAHIRIAALAAEDIDDIRLSSNILFFSCHLEEVGKRNAVRHKISMEIQERNKLADLCGIAEEVVLVDVGIINWIALCFLEDPVSCILLRIGNERRVHDNGGDKRHIA